MAFAALTIDLNAQLAKFEQDMAKATRSMDGFSRKASAAASGLKTAFGALGIGLGAAGLASMAKSAIDSADSMAKLSARTGVAVKDLASLKLVAEQSDVGLEGLGKAMQRLTLSVGQAQTGSKEIGEALGRLGVTSSDARERLFQLADAYKRSGGDARTLADLQKVLGKSYSDMIPLLQQGGDALRKAAEASQSFGERMAKLAPDAEKFNDELDALRQNAAGAAASITSRLLPGLAETATRVRELMDENKGVQALVRAFAGLGKIPFDVIFGNIAPANSAADRIKELDKELAGLRQRLKDVSPGGGKSSVLFRSIFGQPEDIKREITVIENQILALQKFGDKVYKPKAQKAALPGLEEISAQATRAARAQADPLAGILGQTDTAKIAEFERLQAMLDARFKANTLSGKQYAEALTILRERYFSDELKQYREQLEYTAETERLMAEHLRETENQLAAQREAIMDAGRALEDEMRTPLERANIELARLQWLLDQGAISFETFARASFKVQEGLDGAAEKFGEMDSFAKTAAENIQGAFADFLFNPFDKGMKGMLQSFGQTIQRMIAEAVAADLARHLFGDLVKGGSGSGVFGGLLNSIGGLFGGPRALGGPVSSSKAYLVGERGPELFVPGANGAIVPNNALRSGGHTIVVNVNGTRAPDVRRAAGQGAREALAMLNGAQRYA